MYAILNIWLNLNRAAPIFDAKLMGFKMTLIQVRKIVSGNGQASLQISEMKAPPKMSAISIFVVKLQMPHQSP